MPGIPGTYPCGVPAAGPLREDAIIVGKSKLVRPVAVTGVPSGLQEGEKPLVEYQCNEIF